MEEDLPVFGEMECDLYCRFEWIEVSSNFFSVAVYSPALIASLFAYTIYKIYKKSQKAQKKIVK